MVLRLRLDEWRRICGYSQEYMANKFCCHRNTYAKTLDIVVDNI